MSRCLCIFARTPALGRVKQRLAATIGEDEALAAHEVLLRGAIERTAGAAGTQVELWLTSLTPPLPDWLEALSLPLREQGEGDLGQRMAKVLDAALASHERAVLIGSDCPDIDRNYVESAFSALADADVVFGPAEDGGYGLVGLRHPAAAVFAETRWGDAGVLARALGRAADAGLSVSLLPEIYDVDEEADWRRYQRTLGVSSAPPSGPAPE